MIREWGGDMPPHSLWSAKRWRPRLPPGPLLAVVPGGVLSAALGFAAPPGPHSGPGAFGCAKICVGVPPALNPGGLRCRPPGISPAGRGFCGGMVAGRLGYGTRGAQGVSPGNRGSPSPPNGGDGDPIPPGSF